MFTLSSASSVMHMILQMLLCVLNTWNNVFVPFIKFHHSLLSYLQCCLVLLSVIKTIRNNSGLIEMRAIVTHSGMCGSAFDTHQIIFSQAIFLTIQFHIEQMFGSFCYI